MSEQTKLVEHAIDMLEAAKATHDPAKIAKAQALLDMVRGWVRPTQTERT